MASAPDPSVMARHDEEKLRRFLAASRAGDERAAIRWWEELLTENFDRVHGLVKSESRGHLARHEQDEALQMALIKIASNMISTFQGTTMGEWFNAVRTLVKFACIDVQRKEASISTHERSLEAQDRNDDSPGWDPQVFEAIEDRRREQQSAEDDLQALSAGQEFLDWAIPQLSDKQRAVMELDRAGVPVEEMQRQLDITRDSVYAARSRSLKDFKKMREERQQ